MNQSHISREILSTTYEDDSKDLVSEPLEKRNSKMEREVIQSLVSQAEIRVKNHLLRVMLDRMQNIEESFRLQMKETVNFFQELMESVTLEGVMDEVSQKNSVGASRGHEVGSERIRRSPSLSAEREFKRPRLQGIDDRESSIDKHALRFSQKFTPENRNSKSVPDSERTKAELSDIKFDPRSESLSDFLDRFDEKVKEIRRYGTFYDEEAKVRLLLKMEKHIPFVNEIFKPAKKMSMGEIKTLLLAEEYRMKLDGRKKEKDNGVGEIHMRSHRNAQSKSMERPHLKDDSNMKCFKCSEFGHTTNECNSEGWMCFECNKITDHIGPTCPYKQGPSGFKGMHRRN